MITASQSLLICTPWVPLSLHSDYTVKMQWRSFIAFLLYNDSLDHYHHHHLSDIQQRTFKKHLLKKHRSSGSTSLPYGSTTGPANLDSKCIRLTYTGNQRGTDGRAQIV